MGYMFRMWAAADISFEIGEVDDPAAEVFITTPEGQIQVLAEFEERGKCLRLLRLDIQSELPPQALTIGRIRLIAAVWKEWATMKSKLKERLARLGPIRDTHRALSGSPADVVLRPTKGLRGIRVLDAVRLLTETGVSLLKAKRAIEAMIERGEFALRLPAAGDTAALASGLRAAGIALNKLAEQDVDVRHLRKGLGLSREQFALRFNLSIDSVAKWEVGERKPDRAANNYLRVIAADAKVAARAQEEGPSVATTEDFAILPVSVSSRATVNVPKDVAPFFFSSGIECAHLETVHSVFLSGILQSVETRDFAWSLSTENVGYDRFANMHLTPKDPLLETRAGITGRLFVITSHFGRSTSNAQRAENG